MQYENIIHDVYNYFLNQDLSTCMYHQSGYQMMRDEKSGRHYFKNEDNPNQIVIGYIREKSLKTYICLGIIEVTPEEIKEQVFFCRLFCDPIVPNKKCFCYLEQGIVKEKDEIQDFDGLNDIVNYGISENVLLLLRAQREELYRLFCCYDVMNLPSYLKLIEKSIIRRPVTAKKNSWISQEEDLLLSERCQLTPLDEKEKLILEMIYRKTREEKERLETYDSKIKQSGKQYVLKAKSNK